MRNALDRFTLDGAIDSLLFTANAHLLQIWPRCVPSVPSEALVFRIVYKQMPAHAEIIR